MQRDETVFLMGEEVGHYNGAYKVSQGLLEEFSERRVVDTPIAELGFSGVGVGAAMTGLRPIIEFMSFNFSLVAIDQIINHAAKMYQMSAGQFHIPMVFRGPSGPAVQVGAQHSQSFESYFCFVPGLKVVSPSNAADAKGLLKTAIRDNNPVIFLESELLYNRRGEVPEGEHLVPFGKAKIKREGSQVTLIAWSKMVEVAMETAEELERIGIAAEVIDPRSLRPLDMETMVRSVQKTGRCVIVEVGWESCGLGAQIAYQLQRECLDFLDAPVERVTSEDVPMPYAKNLEQEVMPQVKDVMAAVKHVLYLE